MIGAGSAGSRHTRTLLGFGHEVVAYDPGCSAPLGARPAESLALALDGAEAAIVASPNSLHAEHALAAIAAGVPVLVEKPLATTRADAGRIVDAANRAGVLCATAMNLRHHPALVFLRKRLSEGAVGRPLLATASFGYDLRLWRPQTDYRHSYSARSDLGGGVLLDAIHELDYLLWLLGRVAGVSAMTAKLSDLEIDVEDAVVACIRFDSGVLATLDLNYFESAYRRGCTVVGTHATAMWEWNASTVTIRGADEITVEIEGDVASTYEAEVVDFLDAAAGRSELVATAMDGYAAVAVAEAIRESAQQGREVAPEPWE